MPGEEESKSGRSGYVHGKPCPGMTCALTWDDIDEEEYVEYRTSPSGTWHASKYSAMAVRSLLNTQFADYITNIEKASTVCAASVRRLVTDGPPVDLFD